MRRFPKLSETFILNQITWLLDAGHEVDIYAGGSDETVAHRDVQSYELIERTRYPDIPESLLPRVANVPGLLARHGLWKRPRLVAGALDARSYGRSATSLTLLYTAASFADRRAYDVIHCQFGTLAETAVALVDIGATEGAIVVSLRGSDLTKPEERADYPSIFSRCAALLPVCSAFAELLERMGCEPSKIHVHRSGLVLDRFPFAERKLDSGEVPHLVSVARLEEKKGIGFAIDAIARLMSDGRKVRYTVVGDGSLRDELERRVERHGLSDQIRLVGRLPQHEVVELLETAHVLLAPSVTASNGDQEGIPNVLKEAMAMGMPVVSTWHSGIPELVEDGVSGYLVPERDVPALADRIATLIDMPDAWPAMGIAGRQRVERDYDVERLNQELVELYRAVIRNEGAGASD